ncbi:MAG TPA: hypothetical protein VGW79_02055 [Actinomycetota bacterium]|nr:hypothetical protein [Actinomycetota bacterium]
MTSRTILLVEYDVAERQRIGDLLERGGFTVMSCPGPGEPDYVCVGGRGLRCPLAEEADVIVLDMRLASDVMMRGTPAWELLIYYMEHGRRIVAVSNSEDSVHPLSDDRVIAIRRPAVERSLIRAVRELLARTPKEERHRGYHLAR